MSKNNTFLADNGIIYLCKHTVNVGLSADISAILTEYLEKDIIKEEYNDTAMYRMLSEQRPEGKIKLNPQEKKDFEKIVWKLYGKGCTNRH